MKHDGVSNSIQFKSQITNHLYGTQRKQSKTEDSVINVTLTSMAASIPVSMHQNDIIIHNAVFRLPTGRLNWFRNVTSGRSESFGVATSCVHRVCVRYCMVV
jgi:hypothetical protein